MRRVGVISVGGLGSRLEAQNIQKCLIALDGRPIASYVLDALKKSGVEVVFYLTGLFSDQVNSYLTSISADHDLSFAQVYGGISGEVNALLRLKHLIREDFVYAGGDCIVDYWIIEKLCDDAAKLPESLAIMALSESPDGAPEHPRVITDGDCYVDRVTSASVNLSQLTITGVHYFRKGIFEVLEKVPYGSHHTSDFVTASHQLV